MGRPGPGVDLDRFERLRGQGRAELGAARPAEAARVLGETLLPFLAAVGADALLGHAHAHALLPAGRP